MPVMQREVVITLLPFFQFVFGTPHKNSPSTINLTFVKRLGVLRRIPLLFRRKS